MPRDDIAMRSQEFGLAANQSVQPAWNAMHQSIQNFTGTLMQGAQMAQQKAQQNRAFDLQQQEQDVRKEVAVSSIALDRVRKQQALEELNWSRELHTTAMLENQRRALTAQTKVIEAEAEKKIREMGEAKIQPDRLRQEDIDQIQSSGWDWDPQSGSMVEARPEIKSAAQKRVQQAEDLRASIIERNRAAAKAADRMQQREASQGTLRVKALSDAVTTLIAQQVNLKNMPAVTEDEKKKKAEKAGKIQERLEKVEEELRKLGVTPEAQATPAATQGEPDTRTDMQMVIDLLRETGK